MSNSSHRLLGYLVWRGGRWYLRRTYLRWLPGPRMVAAGGGGALILTGALVALGRRARR
jgi:hypothetical protein